MTFSAGDYVLFSSDTTTWQAIDASVATSSGTFGSAGSSNGLSYSAGALLLNGQFTTSLSTNAVTAAVTTSADYAGGPGTIALSGVPLTNGSGTITVTPGNSFSFEGTTAADYSIQLSTVSGHLTDYDATLTYTQASDLIDTTATSGSEVATKTTAAGLSLIFKTGELGDGVTAPAEDGQYGFKLSNLQARGTGTTANAYFGKITFVVDGQDVTFGDSNTNLTQLFNITATAGYLDSEGKVSTAKPTSGAYVKYTHSNTAGDTIAYYSSATAGTATAASGDIVVEINAKSEGTVTVWKNTGTGTQDQTSASTAAWTATAGNNTKPDAGYEGLAALFDKLGTGASTTDQTVTLNNADAILADKYAYIPN